MEIPGYTVIRELGRGGMASVYLAVQESLHREVALKVMAPGFSTEPDFRERFLREGRRNAQLQHPHIVILYDAGYAADRYYIAMEYLRSGNLKDRMQAGVDMYSAIGYTKQIASALGYAHKNGIIHRDIKPLNIMFRDDSTAVLTDFGIAKALSDSNELTRTHMAIGTPYYMSPEQARGTGVDGRSDLYSLGILFYEMLVGERPYVGDEAVAIAIQHLTAPIPKLPDALAALQPVIDRVLAKAPEERYPDAAAFIGDLERLERELTQPAPTVRPAVSPMETTAPRESAPTTTTKTVTLVIDRKRTALYALGVVLVLSVAGGWWWTSRSTLDPQTLRTVQLLIEKAQRHVDASRLTAPAGDNAVEFYREVLALDPENEQALAGIDAVLGRLVEKAKADLRDGKLERALQVVKEGLEIDGDSKPLVALQSKIEQQREILVLVAKGREQLAANKLADPENDNAATSFRAALNLDKDSAEALQGLAEVSGRLLEAARESLARGDLDESARLAEQGSGLDLERGAFDGLRKQIDERRRAAERQRLIAERLESAAKLKSAGELITPQDRNALRLYREVIELDPDNASAWAAIAEIEKAVVAEASAADKKEALESRIERVGVALRAFPENPQLASLEAELNAALAERRRTEQASDLVEAVELRLKTGDLAETEVAELLARVDEAHRLDPSNSRVTSTRKRVISVLVGRAEAATEEGRPSDTIRLAELGLTADPKHKGLRKLLDEAKERIAADKARQQEIEKLLGIAGELAAGGKLVAPPDQNAYAAYGKVLALDSENAEARRGRERVLGQLVERIEASRKAGDLDAALDAADAGLGVAPELDSLKELKQAIVAQQELRATKNEIERLLEDAARDLKSGRLGARGEKGALATYQSILELDPGNKDAKKGVGDVRDGYLAKIRGYLGTDAPQDGIKLADEALDAFPEDSEIAKLRAALATEVQDRNRENEIGELWSRARAQIESGRFTKPAGDNALESYQGILAIDPANLLGRTGIRDLKEALAAQAASAVSERDLERARERIAEAYRVSPNDPEIASVERRADRLEKTLEKQTAVERLIAEAAEHLRNDRLTSPDGKNAVESYQRALALDPDNEEARRGLIEVADRYHELAKEKADRGDLPGGLDLTSRGLAVVPDYRPLVDFRKQVEATADQRDQDARLAALVKRLEEQVKSGSLSAPKGDNAVATLREMEALSPENEKLADARNSILDRYVELVKKQIEEGKYPTSLALIGEAERIAPDDGRWKELREAVAAAEVKAERDDRIAELFRLADEQRNRGRLAEPAGKNAIETLKAILALDVGNSEARRWLREIAKKEGEEAEARLAKEDFDQARVSVAIALEAEPENRDLMSLQERIRKAADRAQRTEEAPKSAAAQLEELIRQGRDQLSSNRLTQPDGDNALETFRRVLEMDPGNQQARDGIGEIADRYAALARRAADQGNWDRGLTYVDRGLGVDPGNGGLRALEGELKRKKEEAVKAARAARAEPPRSRPRPSQAKVEPAIREPEPEPLRPSPQIEASAPKVEAIPKQKEEPKPEPEAPRRPRVFATF